MKNTRYVQQSLLKTFDNAVTSVESKIVYNGIPASKATFKAGQNSLVHRWFRLTPSFGPHLVQEILTNLEYEKNEIVLDPFAGSGTTLIECQLQGISSLGFEINPFLHFVSQTCLNWKLSSTQLKAVLNNIGHNFAKQSASLLTTSLEETELIVPPIHTPKRWWRTDVLKQLLLLKSIIADLSPTVAIKDFFRLGLAAVLVPDLTNVTLGRLQLHFIDRSTDEIDVWSTFYQQVNVMIEDLESLSTQGLVQWAKIILTDSTDLTRINVEHKANLVITSPPYPNRYSYVWNTRPHLYMLDFFGNAKQASDLDKATIGGTWGTATSLLSKGEIKPEHHSIHEVVSPVVNQIRERDNLMANYVMKYFNLLQRQIVTMEPILAANARLAYVVGCSRIKDVFVETDVLLAHIFDSLGYRVESIERIRKRNSGKDLHESIVYAWRY